MIKLAIAVLVLATAASFGAAQRISAEEPAILRIVPESQLVASTSGDINVSVDISLDHHATVPVDDDRDTVPDRDATSEGLGGFEFEVRYDPAILVLREIVATDFLGTFEVVCIVRDVDSPFQPGRAPIGCVRVGSDPGPQGSGAIATLKFRPLAPGTTQLELFGARLAGPLGEDIPVSTEHASISVEYAEDHTAAVRIKPSDFRVSEDVPLFAVTIEVADLTHYGLLPVDGDRDGTVDFHRLSDGLGAFEFTFHYDPSVVELVSHQESDFLASTGRIATCLVRQQPGEFTFGCLSSEPGGRLIQGPQGTGSLVTLLLRPVRPGTGHLSLTHVVLAGPYGEPIPVVSEDATIEVGGAPSPTAVATTNRASTPTPLPILPPAGRLAPTSSHDKARLIVALVLVGGVALLTARSVLRRS